MNQPIKLQSIDSCHDLDTSLKVHTFGAHSEQSTEILKSSVSDPNNVWYTHSLIVCLTTGPKTLPKRALHIVRSRASSFKWEYPFLSLRSSNSYLRLLPCLPVTSISPCIFSSVTRCRRQFRRKMWPIQFAFLLRISCRIFLCSLTLSNTSLFLTWSVQLIFSLLLPHHRERKLKEAVCKKHSLWSYIGGGAAFKTLRYRTEGGIFHW
jgi:hypothetical protein